MNLAATLCQLAVVAVILGLIAYDLRADRLASRRGGETWQWDDPDWQTLRQIAHEKLPAACDRDEEPVKQAGI